jgi:hypothetical protein
VLCHTSQFVITANISFIVVSPIGSLLRSDPRRSRARAIQRLAALGEMTGGIAHDFRNLLAIIDSGLRVGQKQFRAAGESAFLYCRGSGGYQSRSEISLPAFDICEAAGTRGAGGGRERTP